MVRGHSTANTTQLIYGVAPSLAHLNSVRAQFGWTCLLVSMYFLQFDTVTKSIG